MSFTARSRASQPRPCKYYEAAAFTTPLLLLPVNCLEMVVNGGFRQCFRASQNHKAALLDSWASNSPFAHIYLTAFTFSSTSSQLALNVFCLQEYWFLRR